MLLLVSTDAAAAASAAGEAGEMLTRLLRFIDRPCRVCVLGAAPLLAYVSFPVLGNSVNRISIRYSKSFRLQFTMQYNQIYNVSKKRHSTRVDNFAKY